MKDKIKCVYCKKRTVCKFYYGFDLLFPAKKNLPDDNNYITHRWDDAKYCAEFEQDPED